MAAIFVYATVKGCQKYQSKKSQLSPGSENNLSKNRESISRLVIPSLLSATVIPGGEEPLEERHPSQYGLRETKEPSKRIIYTTSHSPEIINPPTRSALPPPVMLGLTLCESPITPPDELNDYFPSDSQNRIRGELQANCPLYRLSQAFDQAGEESFEEVTSPAPLRFRKRSPWPLQSLDEEPDKTYSLDEDENCVGKYSRERSTCLEGLESADELVSFELPPIPPKSPARKFRVVSI